LWWREFVFTLNEPLNEVPKDDLYCEFSAKPDLGLQCNLLQKYNNLNCCIPWDKGRPNRDVDVSRKIGKRQILSIRRHRYSSIQDEYVEKADIVTATKLLTQPKNIEIAFFIIICVGKKKRLVPITLDADVFISFRLEKVSKKPQPKRRHINGCTGKGAPGFPLPW
jgi:hypothetical protein